MNFLPRRYTPEVLQPEVISSGMERTPSDNDVIVEGMRVGIPSSQDLATVAQMLISTGAERAGGRKTAVVNVIEPGLFGGRSRMVAHVTSELEVWVRGRR